MAIDMSTGAPRLRYDSTIEEFETVTRYWTHLSDAGNDGTHAEVFRLSWNHDRDLMVESNFWTALGLLTATEENDPSDIEDDICQDVWDTVTGEFSAPADRIIVVRVRSWDGNYTAAFREAYRLCLQLLNGVPYLDEEDFSGREYDLFQNEVFEAIESITEGSSDLGPLMDSPDDLRTISLWTQEMADELDPHADGGHVSQDAVQALWTQCRDLYYMNLGKDRLADWEESQRQALQPLENQLSLPL